MGTLHHDPQQSGDLEAAPAANASTSETLVDRVHGTTSVAAADVLATEEPLEIQLEYGPFECRTTEPIAITMRTPGHDLELAVGFLFGEGIIRGRADVIALENVSGESPEADDSRSSPLRILRTGANKNAVRIQLASHVSVDASRLSRNFYMTSSCGVCGKSSLMALQNSCPPRCANRFSMSPETLYTLPGLLRQAQTIFDRTGGLHGAALFSADGNLISMREDVGRHNAVDKLIGSRFLSSSIPLHDTLLMLSGRASFELLQKALIAGIPMVASVGAPSSLAVDVARQFDVSLIGFLRDDRFNVYHGREHLTGVKQSEAQKIQ